MLPDFSKHKILAMSVYCKKHADVTTVTTGLKGSRKFIEMFTFYNTMYFFVQKWGNRNFGESNSECIK